MKKYLYIFSLALLCALMICNRVLAIKSSTNIIKYKQPNGSVVLLKMYGDEFFSYSKTLDGYIVSKGADGYLYYANYDKGFLSLTNERVSGSNLKTRSEADISGRSISVPRETVLAIREKALQMYNNSRTSDQYAGSSKNISSLVLLVQFADKKFSINNAYNYFNDLLNKKGYSQNGATGSAADYLNTNFGIGYNFTFNLHGLYTLPGTVESYGRRSETMSDVNIAVMVEDACNAALRAGVDFSKYDSNNDGVVDNVAIIFAGCNEAESANSSLIWPHKGDVQNLNITCGGVKIGSYTCSSEYSGSEVNPVPASIGIFCHEYLHSWGLPDLYDVNGEEEGLAKALYKKLSIMDEGYYSNDGKTPPYFSSIEREILNLASVKTIIAGNSYKLLPVQTDNSIYRLPTFNEDEYFLIECRNGKGWDRYITGSGMIIYHIDKSKNICGGLEAWRRWELNIINSYAPHECASVLAAEPFVEDGSLESIFYPGLSATTLISYSSPVQLTDKRMIAIGTAIEEIAYEDEIVTFSAIKDVAFDETFPAATSVTAKPYQKNAIVEWKLPNISSVNGRQSGGAWHVLFGEKDSAVPMKETLTKNSFYVIDSLKTDTEYTGKLYYTYDGVMGRVVTFSFKTDKPISEYPYLKFIDKCTVGSVVCFAVQNLADEYYSVTINLNGKNLDSNYYEFKESGEYVVEVFISYPDGSQDVITKKIVVE